MVSVLGAFILDHLQPVELILFHKFSTFFTFILGSPIRYYPRGNVGKPGTFPCTYIQSEEKSMWPLKEDL